MGEAISLVNNFKVEKVIFNCGEFNELEKELILLLEKLNKDLPIYDFSSNREINKNKVKLLNI